MIFEHLIISRIEKHLSLFRKYSLLDIQNKLGKMSRTQPLTQLSWFIFLLQNGENLYKKCQKNELCRRLDQIMTKNWFALTILYEVKSSKIGP